MVILRSRCKRFHKEYLAPAKKSEKNLTALGEHILTTSTYGVITVYVLHPCISKINSKRECDHSSKDDMCETKNIHISDMHEKAGLQS